MAIITRNDVCECEVCGHEWLPERGKKFPPNQCPSRKCRSTKWNLRGVAENRVMPKSRRAADTSVGGGGSPELTLPRGGASPSSPTRSRETEFRETKIVPIDDL